MISRKSPPRTQECLYQFLRRKDLLMSQTPAAQSGDNRFVRGIGYLTEMNIDFNKKPELRRKLKS